MQEVLKRGSKKDYSDLTFKNNLFTFMGWKTPAVLPHAGKDMPRKASFVRRDKWHCEGNTNSKEKEGEEESDEVIYQHMHTCSLL